MTTQRKDLVLTKDTVIGGDLIAPNNHPRIIKQDITTVKTTYSVKKEVHPDEIDEARAQADDESSYYDEKGTGSRTIDLANEDEE